ncbi:hypothetical protein [Faecalibacterium sp. An192]|uniref:hypothetical protein n=1 Tax=Faecalibacterium sp. An192 TaxID=1965581 RepID=UPI000B380453|nr:hypothetical protein [Faecalibacterium sp. An192]OUP30069.1 hypothetical protein B5F27_01450 [Faecalibacterium sp. An192]
MLAKKVTALFVSAALVLALLAGCGGSKALSQVIADLLSGLYTNVDVEVDSDLTAALKKAAAEGGTEDEILTRLVNNLNITGGSITFTRLGDGQQGDHGVDLVFQTGSDPDAAARSALAQWASVFGSLPDDGSYRAHVSMIEGENGYYIAVDVEVLKAGTPDKGDSGPSLGPNDVGYEDDDYSVEWADESSGQKLFKVKTATGLIAWANYVRAGNWNTNCTLEEEANIDLTTTGNWEPIGTDDNNAYTGIFDGNGKTITGLTINNVSENVNVGMFAYNNGIVKNLTLNEATIKNDLSVNSVGIVVGENLGTITGCSVSGTVSHTATGGAVGGVAGSNYGTITDCSMENGSVIGDNSTVGGLIGLNPSTDIVDNCHVSNVTVQGSAAGGLVGENATFQNSITGCWVENGSVTGSACAGGVVGRNEGEIIACYHINGSISRSGSASSSAFGGVAGNNTVNGKLTACYHSGSDISGSTNYTGGVVGNNLNRNTASITACYWSGYNGKGTGTLSSNKKGVTQVTNDGDGDTVTWAEALEGLNNAASASGYQFDGMMDAPFLSK